MTQPFCHSADEVLPAAFVSASPAAENSPWVSCAHAGSEPRAGEAIAAQHLTVLACSAACFGMSSRKQRQLYT